MLSGKIFLPVRVKMVKIAINHQSLIYPLFPIVDFSLLKGFKKLQEPNVIVFSKEHLVKRVK